MVASYSRGMRLLRTGGGARARGLGEGLTQKTIHGYQHPADAESGQDVTQIAIRSARRVIAVDRDEVEGQVGPLREEAG